MDKKIVYTREEWLAESVRRFGEDVNNWRFICPSCGYIARVKEWRDLDAHNSTAISCIGRYTNPPSKQTIFSKTGGPCNYAGYGLFKLNPIKVVTKEDDGSEHDSFAFDWAYEETKEKNNG